MQQWLNTAPYMHFLISILQKKNVRKQNVHPEKLGSSTVSHWYSFRKLQITVSTIFEFEVKLKCYFLRNNLKSGILFLSSIFNFYKFCFSFDKWLKVCVTGTQISVDFNPTNILKWSMHLYRHQCKHANEVWHMQIRYEICK